MIIIKKQVQIFLILVLSIMTLVGCSSTNAKNLNNNQPDHSIEKSAIEKQANKTHEKKDIANSKKEKTATNNADEKKDTTKSKEEKQLATTKKKKEKAVEKKKQHVENKAEKVKSESSNQSKPKEKSQSAKQNSNTTVATTLTARTCDHSGYRKSNAVVDVGFGNRKYYAYTNGDGQLVKVKAKKIILQRDNEKMRGDGRYCYDEANVPGTEKKYLDKGHVIADSLGGVSNAYNITPEGSYLNRYGHQASFERLIRKSGGAENFLAIITYPNHHTQVPSKYDITFYINGTKHHYAFANNHKTESTKTHKETQKIHTKKSSSPTQHVTKSTTGTCKALEKYDTNHNGMITISEAKDGGLSMPVRKADNPCVYQYMRDNDHDGMVGE